MREAATISEDRVRGFAVRIDATGSVPRIDKSATEGSVSIFVPIFATLSEDGVREAYLVDGEADEGTGPVSVPIPTTTSDAVREVCLVVPNGKGSVSIFVPISAISEDDVCEAYLVDDEADEEIGSVSNFVPIAATISEDEVREAYMVDGEVDEEIGTDARFGAERGTVFVFVDTIDAVVSIGCCCCCCCIIVTIDTVLFCCIPVTSIGDDDGFAAAAAGASTHL